MIELPCPTCGSELNFLEQYQRYYCHQCQHYAPEGYGAHGAKKCPTCGGILSYVVQYDRFYCFRCNAYAAVEATAPAAVEPVPVAEPAPKAEPAPEAKPTEPVAPLTAAIPAQPAIPPSPQPTPQPAPQAETPQTAKPAASETAPSPAPTATPEPAPAKPAEPEIEGPSKAIAALASAKPAVVRVKVFAMRKSELMDLCKAYDLDPSGTKDQLQERLLSFLNYLEEESQPEAEEPAPVPGPTAETPKEEKAEVPVAPAEAEPHPTTAWTAVAKAPEPAVQTSAGSQTQVVVIEEKPPPVAAPTPIPIVVTHEPVEAPKVEHPCPTCGRELNYISQYGRWYCYFCQRYAPAAKSKNACPTCGATLRWIDQYQRWWCDSCQKYAPADLPRPSGAAAVAAQPAEREAARPVVAAAIAQPTVSAHRHAHPSTGIGLVAFGLVLFILEELLVEFPAVFPMPFGINLPAEAVVVIRFLAFFFVALGAIAGLMALRERA
ncbi:MAG: SAP domain-containing protein [Candidatus Thermoplasmatota archaeon]